MRVVALAAGRSLSVAQLDEVASTLRGATDEPVEVDLFSWSPVEDGAPVRTVRVLGPVTTYRPPAPPPTPQTSPSGDPAPSSGSVVDPSAEIPPEPRPTGRRALGRAHWALRRSVVRFRRGAVWYRREALRRIRRVVRGDIGRQFAATARRNAELADAVRRADVVVTLDQNAIAAAWRLARTVPGPPVVNGLTAARRVLAAAD